MMTALYTIGIIGGIVVVAALVMIGVTAILYRIATADGKNPFQ